MSFYDDDDDDFQIPLTRTTPTPKNLALSQKPLKASSFTPRPWKKPKQLTKTSLAPKQLNNATSSSSSSFRFGNQENKDFESSDVVGCSLDSIPSSFDFTSPKVSDEVFVNGVEKEELLNKIGGFSSNSIESKLIKSRVGCGLGNVGSIDEEDTEGDLDVLLNLRSALEDGDSINGGDSPHHSEIVDDGYGVFVLCPLCGVDISDLSEEQRHIHTNACLDKEDAQAQDAVLPHHGGEPRDDAEAQNVNLPGENDEPPVPRKCADVSAVVEWLRGLGLAKYEDVFVREEIDWDTLQWLTEEDLFSIGITTLGPRKKIVHALSQLRKGSGRASEEHTSTTFHVPGEPEKSTNGVEMPIDVSEHVTDSASKIAANKLITDYFPGTSIDRKKVCNISKDQSMVVKRSSGSGSKQVMGKKNVRKGKLKNPPSWCCVPGTPFQVDAFKYLRGDCSHWFLTHFHMDHYQGLTKSFCHGKIYCSLITATLVNMKIGIPWDRLQVLPLNQKINIVGIDVTCVDANHCPGAIILLFEPPNGKAVLHTGDFRFSEDKDMMALLRTRPIHTLILDTTYCNPQYDFPKQETVIQFVIDAIQAETFNPKTLFLIGSYTIGKERLFLEVARVLRKKIYIPAAKLRILKCLGLPKEDMQWFTQNEKESQIHVVPMWTIASFKRLKYVANQYTGRFSLIVAFSPTGWTFGKGKKKSPGRKWQQGTTIRYEVPYSEHSSFSELREFVKIVSPVNIIPSVNNDGPDSANAMVSLLVS
ncbi:uncharacterized protein LOC133803971 isoform X2 [Humulus lupulus]|uniref:uncharacterized protein LOC133803971 isoform X2 n=1 Tax=Humulus lupulus TaxID=3486 RepID=UPI002B40B280|nr:uncharacterized protein LOC133803971 isoform X2 [Humulus lupulus]